MVLLTVNVVSRSYNTETRELSGTGTMKSTYVCIFILNSRYLLQVWYNLFMAIFSFSFFKLS